ncbi:MAG: UDP-3-O-(3-hydroxymyristoyl)glucosamine N-acyltransferase [Planctomycetota bacterium]
MMTETVSSLAALTGGRVVGDGSRKITAVADLRTAGPDRIGFVRDQKYVAAARSSKAGALITYEELELGNETAQIVVADVGLAFARVASHFHPPPRARGRAVHPTAVVAEGAEFEGDVEIGANAVIGRVRIGAGTVIMAGVTIGDGSRIGRDCVLYPRVTCYHGVVLGDRVLVHSGAVLGSDGFGYARDGHSFVKVPQLGGVRIADDVEIGANCTVDRGAIGDTVIGARTKIDNLCHVAHNCVIGEDCAFAAATFVAGSTVIGDRVIMAGHIAIAGHLSISRDVRVGGNSCILRDVPEPGDYMGHPLVEKLKFIRMMRSYRHLGELFEEVDQLRRAVNGGAGDSRAGGESE